MQKFKSPEVIVNKSAKELFHQIGNLNNLKNILPPQIQNFKSTETTCSFKINGMPELQLKITEKIQFSKISLTAIDSQIPLCLNCFIVENEGECQARLEINTEVNMMTKMMIDKPLTQFLNVLAKKIQNL